jgi:alpha-N-arabinofuranosidase
MSDATLTAHLTLDSERVVGPISPLLFGGFAEHMGRCVYGGLYDPASPQADEQGFRRDVQAALREMGVTILRYPGGNFLSGYHWRDGVGPRDQRPRRRDLAWQSLETNQFGTDEFIAYCRSIGVAPMLGVNLGTGTIEEAGALVEYCNAPVGSANADLRAANGHNEPYSVRYWCLGNEMDGAWQIGHLDAQAYAIKAREAAKIMHWHDPSIKLILCGSSHTEMTTYPEWDREVLEHCWDQVDYLALHYYATNYDDDTASYLASAAQFEEQVDTLAGLLRFMQGRLRSRHRVKLSWDEWNVWYKDRSGRGGWREAPPLSEEVYNLEDALVVAQWLNVLLRRCDVLEIACIAQVVNTIAPLTTRGPELLRQTTFYPFVLVAQNAVGVALDPLVSAPHIETPRYGPQPLLDVAASYDEALQRGTVFLVNRSQTQPLSTTIRWQGAAPRQIVNATQLSGDNPKRVNTFAQPHAVVPVSIAVPPIGANQLTIELPPLSFTVLTTSL